MALLSKITPLDVCNTGALPVGESDLATLASKSGTEMGIELYSAAMRGLKALKEPGGAWRVYVWLDMVR